MTQVGLEVLGWVGTVLSVILRGLSSGRLGCFPLCPGEGEVAGCSSVPGLPVNLAFQNCLCLTQNKSELCMSGRISLPCHTQRCPEYLWKSRQWHPGCRRKQTLSESPGLLWLFRPTQSSALPRLKSKEEALSPGKASPWWPNTCPKRESPRAHLSRTWEMPASGTGGPTTEAQHLPEAELPLTLQPQLFPFP